MAKNYFHLKKMNKGNYFISVKNKIFYECLHRFLAIFKIEIPSIKLLWGLANMEKLLIVRFEFLIFEELCIINFQLSPNEYFALGNMRKISVLFAFTGFQIKFEDLNMSIHSKH